MKCFCRGGEGVDGWLLEEQLSNAFIVSPISDPATRHIPGPACPQISLAQLRQSSHPALPSFSPFFPLCPLQTPAPLNWRHQSSDSCLHIRVSPSYSYRHLHRWTHTYSKFPFVWFNLCQPSHLLGLCSDAKVGLTQVLSVLWPAQVNAP